MTNLLKSSKLLKCSIVSLVFGILFFVLSPGVLLTLPPSSSIFSDEKTEGGDICKGGVFAQIGRVGSGRGGMCATTYAAVAVHSVIFMLIVFVLCWFGCGFMNT